MFKKIINSTKKIVGVFFLIETFVGLGLFFYVIYTQEEFGVIISILITTLICAFIAYKLLSKPNKKSSNQLIPTEPSEKVNNIPQKIKDVTPFYDVSKEPLSVPNIIDREISEDEIINEYAGNSCDFEFDSNVLINKIELDKITPNKNRVGKITFLEWLDLKEYPYMRYPLYFNYQYGLSHLKYIHKNFINKGLLIPPTIEQYYKGLKVIELKEILKANNLKVSGKKEELINRLVENNIEVPFEDDVYTLSDTALDIIKNNFRWIEYYKKTKIITELEFFKAQHDLKERFGFNPSYNDIAWGILNLKYLTAIGERDYRLLRSILNEEIDILLSEKRYEDASDFAIQSILIDLLCMPFIYYPAPYMIGLMQNKYECVPEAIITECMRRLNIENPILPKKDILYIFDVAYNNPQNLEKIVDKYNKKYFDFYDDDLQKIIEGKL